MFDRLYKKLNEISDSKDEKYKFFMDRTNKHIALVKLMCEKFE